MSKKIDVGPVGYMLDSASMMGVELAPEGKAILHGETVEVDTAMREAAKALLTMDNPTIFPGPKVLWDWKEEVAEETEAILALAQEIPNCKIIPMPDYRPKYPMIDPEAEINPNHPNLTILHNRIKSCIFIGVHCHYANLSLRMIRGGTDCYTIALCGEEGHEEAMASIRDLTPDTIKEFTKVLIEERDKLGITHTPTMPPKNSSLLEDEEFDALVPADYGEYKHLIMSRKGTEHVTETE
jgi:hypothetical protein